MRTQPGDDVVREKLRPDFKTIADFPGTIRKLLKNVFKEFVLFCHTMGLITMRRLAVDGTRLRRQNGHGEVYRREKLAEIERAVAQGLERPFKEMVELDRRQDHEGIQIRKEKVVELTKKIQRLRRKGECSERVSGGSPGPDKNGRMSWKYRVKDAECAACPKRSCCTKGSGGRMLRVAVHHRELKAYFEQLENPERKTLTRKRKELSNIPLARSNARLASGTFCSEGLRR